MASVRPEVLSTTLAVQAIAGSQARETFEVFQTSRMIAQLLHTKHMNEPPKLNCRNLQAIRLVAVDGTRVSIRRG